MIKKSMFASRLTERRIELKFTQESIAEKIGISRERYANYEQSRREPDFEIVKLFAEILKTSTDYLLGNTNDPNPPQNELLRLAQEGQIQQSVRENNISLEDIEILKHIKELKNNNKPTLEVVYEVANKMNLDDRRKEALGKIKSAPVEEQQARLNEAIEQYKNLSPEAREALRIIIKNLAAAQR